MSAIVLSGFVAFLSVTVFSAGSVFVDPSGYVNVAFPLSSTVTSFASGFAFLTSSTTFAFSSSVNLSLFSTSVLTGSLAGFFSASVFAFSVTVCSGVKVLIDPSGYVNVAFPLSSTVTSFASGFAFLTSSTTFAFSSSVNLSLFSTSVLTGSLAGFFSASVFAFSVTVCSGVKVLIDPSG